ncbi:MAG: DUF4859 domain-containing protein, partial [Bacteroidaceae bacterium]|nr:DUF4859 domain-containing protein [Bacteroidaceae bacterium]
QWQANQSYPELKWSQSWGLFRQTANYAMTHEWMRYQSYWWLYYLADKYGLDIVGRLWRHDPKKAADPNESLMSLMQWDVNRLYKECFDYAMKMATLDISVTRNEADPYIGTLDYHYVPLGGTAYQVAYASCPQASGFNVVPLSVPEAGTEVTVDFTSLKAGSLLAEGDPVEYFDGNSMAKLSRTRYNSTSSYTKRGFRLGFVALMADGTRQYMAEDSVYCASGMSDRSCQVGCVVPEGVERLFLVVSPAPAVYYQHQWDEDITNDDHFPYTIILTGSNILGAPVLDDRLPLTDATLTFDVTFPASGDYSGASVTIDGEALSALGTAFQLQGGQLDATMTAWSATVPDDGKTKFYACNSLGKIVNQGSTANGYGHWFNASGTRCDYGSGYVFSEFDPATLTFSIGQFPNRLQNGQTYTIRQALKHRRDVVGDDGSTEKQYGLVAFVFRIRVTDDAPAGGTLASVEQDPIVTPVHNVTPDRLAPPAYYSLSGQRLQRPRRGVTIVRQSDGTARKIINE